jgi:hypothetical protein
VTHYTYVSACGLANGHALSGSSPRGVINWAALEPPFSFTR